MLSFKEGQPNNESPCIGKEDLRQVQGHHPPRGGQGDLRERKAQAAPGLVEAGISRNLHGRGRDQRSGISKKSAKLRVSKTVHYHLSTVICKEAS